MTRPDDIHRVLLRQIVLRDARSEAAMAKLYQALSGRVFAFARHHLYGADEHRVQSVVVDTLFEVWRSAAQFGGQAQVLTWVLGIARHKLLDSARRQARHDDDEDIDEHAETLADERADIVTQLAEKQRAEWLAYCMARLPAEQRECLHLLLVQGMSVDDISRLQQCPSGTVKTRVFHAKHKLKSGMLRWLKNDIPAAELAASRSANVCRYA